MGSRTTKSNTCVKSHLSW